MTDAHPRLPCSRHRWSRSQQIRPLQSLHRPRCEYRERRHIFHGKYKEYGWVRFMYKHKAERAVYLTNWNKSEKRLCYPIPFHLQPHRFQCWSGLQFIHRVHFERSDYKSIDAWASLDTRSSLNSVIRKANCGTNPHIARRKPHCGNNTCFIRLAKLSFQSGCSNLFHWMQIEFPKLLPKSLKQ